MQNTLPGFGFNIYSQASFIAVDGKEVNTFALNNWRNVLARLVAHAGALNLNYVGS